MSRLDLAALLVAAFIIGAYLALLVRGLLEDATQRRLRRATKEALGPEDFDRLRDFIGRIDERERARVG